MRYIKQSTNSNGLIVFQVDMNNEEMKFIKSLAEDFLMKVPLTPDTHRARGRARNIIKQIEKAINDTRDDN